MHLENQQQLQNYRGQSKGKIQGFFLKINLNCGHGGAKVRVTILVVYIADHVVVVSVVYLFLLHLRSVLCKGPSAKQTLKL